MSESNGFLPAPLSGLRPLAANLRWGWRSSARELFERIDRDRWQATGGNPIRLLRETPADTFERLARDSAFVAAVQAESANLWHYLSDRGTWWGRRRKDGGVPDARIAYFSAEFGIVDCLPIFSGGLGVLAGDHLKSASDLGVPLVGVGLLYREGYFTQEIGDDGRQHARYVRVDPADLPIRLERDADGQDVVIRFPMLDRRVAARVWRADVGRVRLYLLDTDFDANTPEDRRITDRLYGGDLEHRLRQEIVLGIGGMRALAALGLTPTVIHLNEGHAAFAAIERARQLAGDAGGAIRAAAGPLAQGVVFTTHTPVPAGHDHFPPEMVDRHLGGYVWEMHEAWDAFLHLGLRPSHRPDTFCMTTLALRTSARRNGVSRLHGEVTREMWRSIWPDRPVDEVPIGHVTNGVHLATWVSDEMGRVFDDTIGRDWPDAFGATRWQVASNIPLERLWEAKRLLRMALVRRAREALAAQVARSGRGHAWTERALDPDALTIVFARRFATYKRATLLLTDPERLTRLVTGPRPVQFVFAGKAHPRDLPGQEFLRRIAEFAARHDVRERFVLLEGYDVDLARHLVQGADVWLNMPRRPHEASGTSGMKAAANGALNLSIADGWWAEAWIDHNRFPDPIGWCIDAEESAVCGDQDAADAQELFRLLEYEVVPLYYDRTAEGLPEAWLRRVRAAIQQVIPFFNTHRMVAEYVDDLYVPAHWEGRDGAAAPAAEGA